MQSVHAHKDDCIVSGEGIVKTVNAVQTTQRKQKAH